MRQRGLLASVFAALATTVVLFSLTGYQVTTASAATRLLSRLAAAIIEVDRWLPVHRDDIELLARDRPESVVRLAGLPIAVTLPSKQIAGADESTVRTLLVETMGRALYEQGNNAFRDEKGVRRAPGVDAPVHWAVRLLSRDFQGFWKAAVALSLLVLLAFCASVLYAGRPLLPPIALGAGLGAAASFAAWLLAEVASEASRSPVDKEIALILRDGAWIGLRNSLAIATAAIGLLLLFRAVNRQGADWRGGETAPSLPPERPSA